MALATIIQHDLQSYQGIKDPLHPLDESRKNLKYSRNTLHICIYVIMLLLLLPLHLPSKCIDLRGKLDIYVMLLIIAYLIQTLAHGSIIA